MRWTSLHLKDNALSNYGPVVHWILQPRILIVLSKTNLTSKHCCRCPYLVAHFAVCTSMLQEVSKIGGTGSSYRLVGDCSRLFNCPLSQSYDSRWKKQTLTFSRLTFNSLKKNLHRFEYYWHIQLWMEHKFETEPNKSECTKWSFPSWTAIGFYSARTNVVNFVMPRRQLCI